MRDDCCNNCFYFDKCSCGIPCCDFTPLIDDCNDSIFDIIEGGRDEYRTAWFDYIKDFN